MAKSRRGALLFYLPFTLTATTPLLWLTACQEKSQKVSTIFRSNEAKGSTAIDLGEIESNGELIAATLSGPDTYYEFRGQGFGLQYELISYFARQNGLRIRMEIAHDIDELYAMLDRGDVDVIAYPLPDKDNYTQCAITDSTHHEGWVTRTSSPLLAESIHEWYNPSRIKEIQEKQKKRERATKLPARHHPQPKVLDANRGVISNYDGLFKRYAMVCGWDWRLLAAQGFQESAFDPNAVSWAGAQGLMQLMPKTAAHYGAQDNVFDPETNIRGAVKLICNLNSQFSDITNSDERINFILASYNGGQGHVRDAMALAQKYGANPHKWDEVRQYILLLSDPQYYRDPVVKCGYLRGKETEGYVSAIRSHWNYYKGLIK